MAVRDEWKSKNRARSVSFQRSAFFFLVVTPGLERQALYEMYRALPEDLLHQGLKYEVHTGGIEVLLPLNVGLSLNFLLRIPTRILLRLGTCPQLLLYQDFQKWLRTLKLEKYFPLRHVFVSTRSSKLKMKEKLKRVFLNTYPFKEDANGSDIYVRFFRDECTVSVDTSGEDLYQRGQKKWVGEAPLRETMAAALLQVSLAGVQDLSKWQVVDPMMGSGTFLTEALNYGQPLRRDFCFQNWHLLSFSESPPAPSILSVWGSDKDAETFAIAQKNLEHFSQAKKDLQLTDLFQLHPLLKKSSRLVISNPPYGKRLKIQQKNFYSDLILKIKDVFDPDRIGLLIPAGKELIKPQGYQKLQALDFSNNGIDVQFHLFIRESIV